MNDQPIHMLPEEGGQDQSRSDAEIASEEALAAKVDAFGASLTKRRDEAIAARKNSGIEDEWRRCEEAYEGIDDANRGATAAMGKPSSADGGYYNGAPEQEAGRSTVFLNITRPYVDAAAARVGDMLLPTDDTPWALRPTPIATTVQTKPMASMDVMQQAGAMPQMSPGMELLPAVGQPAMQVVPGMPPQKSPLALAMEQEQQAAKEKAEKATKQIEDWLVECQWHAEVRKMIEDCARLGTGILKGPFPVKRKSRVTVVRDGVIAFEMRSEIKPGTKAISPWKFYPDGGCGEDIQDGSGTWEVDSITAKGLRDLKGLPGYLDWQIDRVLEQGPGVKRGESSASAEKNPAKDSDNYEIWYGYCFATREDLEAAGVEIPADAREVTVPAVVTLVNDVVIKAALSPLDSGEFPYDVMPWQRRTGMPYGTGVAMQINTPQRMINAGSRSLMDNAGLSSGPQIVIDRDAIETSNGNNRITPRKIWYRKAGSSVPTKDAIVAIDIPTRQPELLAIIQFALKMAEDVTGLPMLMQGQAGQQTPDTVGGMQLVDRNASVVLRRIARMFDDKVTEPHIRRYYEWLLMYHDDDTIKGDYQIDARGSTALVERDMQNQAIIQMGNLVMNPAFGVDPEKWFSEYLKALRLDPQRFQMDEAKKQQLQNQPPPKAPAVEAAQIRASAQVQTAQIKEQGATQRAAIDTDRDAVYVQAENDRTQLEHQDRMTEYALKRELAMLDYANKRNLSLDQVKADLAQTAMKLQTTKELAASKASADQMPTPPVEPPGRAPAGESFQK